MASKLEEELGHPLQWSICFLHHLDRPWLHLLLALDGQSLGPESFSGPIGQKITSEVHLLPVANVTPIVTDDFPCLPRESVKKLSKDTQDL